MGNVGSEHSAGYWPGYVDALVNVVLNLVFLSAILAVGSFTLGLESSRRRLPDKKVDGQAVRAIAGSNSRFKAIPKPEPQPGGKASSDQLGMRFAEYTVRLDDSARERLENELKRQISQGVEYWRVSIDADVKDKMQRRAAYLRMMSVRNVFLEVGIDLTRVDLRIQAADVSGAGTQMVRIMPEWNVPKRKLPATSSEKGPDTSFPQPEGQEVN